MSNGLKNRIAANYAENDTDYVYIDCFGRYTVDNENAHFEMKLMKIVDFEMKQNMNQICCRPGGAEPYLLPRKPRQDSTFFVALILTVII